MHILAELNEIMKKLIILVFIATFFLVGCEKPNLSIPEEDNPTNPKEAFERRIRSGGRLDKSNVLFDKKADINWEKYTKLSDSLFLFELDIKDSVVLSQGNGGRILMNNRIFLLAELKSDWTFAVSSLFPNPEARTKYYSGTMLKQSYFSGDASYSNFHDGYPIVSVNESTGMATKGNKSSLVSRWVTTCTSVNAYVNGVYKGTTTTCNQVWDYEPVGEWQVPMPDVDGGDVTYVYVDENYADDKDLFNRRIDDSSLPDCMKEIIKDLGVLKGNTVADIINRFAGNTPKYQWKVRFSPDNMTTIQFAGTQFAYENEFVTTNLNSDPIAFRYGSDLAFAKTIIHESIHAYLVVLYFTDRHTLLDNYPVLINKLFNTHRKPENDKQHDLFVDNFIGDIKNTLALYGNSKGYDLNDQFYEDMAWGGLAGTDAFLQLDSADQNRINNTLNAEHFGGKINSNGVTQKGVRLLCEQ